MLASDYLEGILLADEEIIADATLPDSRFTVTDRRIAVVTDFRIALDLPHGHLRRIQFDIERDRPATIVIVPERASAEPQVLAVPVDAIETVVKALAYIARHIATPGARGESGVALLTPMDAEGDDGQVFGG